MPYRSTCLRRTGQKKILYWATSILYWANFLIGCISMVGVYFTFTIAFTSSDSVTWQ